MDDIARQVDPIRRRAIAASALPWTVERGSDGVAHIRTGRTDGESRLFVRRDLVPADNSDVEFIALARAAVPRLLGALECEDVASISEGELDEIEAVVTAASAAPWRPFIEEWEPIGGCSMIWIGDGDAPDMYVWLGDDIAPAPDIDFIGYSRQDVPFLIAEVRRRFSAVRADESQGTTTC